MNKLVTLSVASLLASGAFSQTISVNWEQIYGDASTTDTYYDEGFAATENSSGQYVGAGYRQSAPTNGQSDVFIVKTNSDGTSPAESNFGGAGQEKAYGIIATSDNHLLMATDNNAGAGLLKVDNSGNLVFHTSYAPTGIFRKVIETSGGDYVAAGYKDVGGNDKDFFIVKVNSSGTLIWERVINAVGEQIAYSVIETSNGEYIVCGTTNPATNIDGSLIRLDASGAVVWNKTISSGSNDGVYDVIDVSGASESYAYTGTTNGTTFLKFADGAGTETATNEYSQGFSSATAYSMLRLANGNILMAGECLGGSAAGRDGLFNLVSPTGSIITSLVHDAKSFFQDNHTWSIFLASNGNVIACGPANSLNAYPELHLMELAISGGTNAAPTVQGDAASTPQDTPVDISVMANDSDSDGSLLASSITITTQPTNGTVSVNTTTGVITYTPNAGYTGSDSFVYSICDNGTPQLCGTATVSITVTAVTTNQSPVAVDDNGGTVVAGGTAMINVLTNDTDPDGNPTPTSGHTVDLDLVTAGVQTTLNATSPSVTWTYNTATGELTCAPAVGVVGTVTITYQLCDAGALCDDAVVTFDAVVGLDENTLVTKVYPNPVKNVIRIETANEKAVTAKIISMDGKIVATTIVTENEINVPAIKTGTYVLEVAFANGSVSRSIFIKE